MRSIRVSDIEFNVDDPAHEAHWDKVESGQWQDWIFPIYDRLLSKDATYIDFGAWIGATTLYAAQKCHHCFSFEPDPVAFKLLSRNVACNPCVQNITLVNAAVWVERGAVRLGTETGSMGNSDSSILLEGDVEVNAMRFDDFRHSLWSVSDPLHFDIETCNLIKFDIEGAEFAVLEDMLSFLKEKRPSIIVSFHYNRVACKRSYTERMKLLLRFYEHKYDAMTMDDVGDEFGENMLFTDEDMSK